MQERLRDPAEFEGARFELEAASFFLREGFSVEFLSSTTGEAMPDLHIAKDEVELFVEAKILRDSQISQLERELHFRLWFDPTLQSLPVLVSLKLGESMLDLLYGLHGAEAEAMVAAIVQYLVGEIRDQYNEKRAPSRRSIKDYVQCELEPLAGDKTGGVISMHSPSPSPGYELNRVIRNTIPDAAIQLPRSKPSVVAVQVTIGFDFDMGEAMLHKLLLSLKDRYRHVVGVFLVGERFEQDPFRQLYAWRFVRNEASNYPASYLRSVERMR